ncbi:MFS transporter [Smaragdicoccus niigatensis]|uniref:MFS transporter n=1 Tax=Smaragdicoccus niigatensis TaxID=359359 RepID=UPI00037EB20E|nr:MFS transporter [Smaragdicoccus niigatensis]
MSRRTRAIIAICTAAFLAFLDTTIVNVSFPNIAEHFPDASRSDLSWVLDAYFIVIAAFLVPAGELADRLGRKRVFLAALAGFIVTSVLCAIAPSWEFLVGARVLQGVAAAVIAPVSLALLLPEFSIEKRSAGVGIWGAASALAAASGPPLGGLIVDVADWRWIFLVNIPIGIGIYLLGRSALVESSDASTHLPDFIGIVATAGGLGALALGIVEGETWGWGSPRIIGSFVAAAIFLAVLVYRCATHPQPVINPALLKVQSFRRGSIGTFFFAVAFFSMILGNILFLTSVWQYSVLTAGLAVVPGPLASTFIAVPAGKLADKYGHRVVIVPGAIIYALGLVVLRTTDAVPDYLGTWLPGQILIGIGIGLAFPTLGAASVRDLTATEFGSATAVNSAFRQFGAVVGTAVVIAIIGTPTSLAEALTASDHAYDFGITAGLLSGVAALFITRKVPEREKELVAA